MAIESISYNKFKKLKGINKPDHVTIGKDSRTFRYHLKNYILYDKNTYEGNKRDYYIKYTK